jgi:hypothetical protein
MIATLNEWPLEDQISCAEFGARSGLIVAGTDCMNNPK